MLRLRRLIPSTINKVIFPTLIVASFGLGFTQGAPVSAPDNAIAKINGNGWQCDRGYFEVGHACVADVPGDRVIRDICCAVELRTVMSKAKLEKENARLRHQVEALSLKNSVLRSERDDEP
jgi:hypothetical protein